MATTQNTFTGDGSTTNYSFTFEYIKEADVKATLDGTATTAFTLANATTLSFNTAPASGVAIRIFRDTDINSLKATFFPGSAIKAEDLNDNFTQNNFAVQEADFNVDTANATADTAKTNSETAVATANTADANATAAVATANTADTNASAAVATANTASTNASNAVSTANAASTTANSADANATLALNNSRESDGQGGFIAAITKANTAIATANTADTNATSAVNTANAATTTANTASTNASNAVTTANSAASDASSAVSTANTASTNATNAVTTANSAAADATSAVATANTASTNASNAVTTANTADTNATAALNNSRESDGQGGYTSAIDKANTAITTANTATAAVSNAVLFDLVANVAAIPGSPSNNDYIEIGDSTGIQNFTPLSGLPSGFVGASGLTVRLRYDSSATSWAFMSYFANDSESRYVAIGNPNPVYYANQAAFPSATTYHGGIAHSHADGAMYYAHGGNWIKMASESDVSANTSSIATNTANIATNSSTISQLTTSVADKMSVAGGSFTGWIGFGDGSEIRIGNHNDLKLYHDGSNSYIDESGFGNLIIKSNSSTSIQSDTGETCALFVPDGASSLYYDDSVKLSTQNLGVSVTGNVFATQAVQSGADPGNGANQGAELNPGSITLANTNGADAIFIGRTVGSSTVTSRINANGSAEFSNGVVLHHDLDMQDNNRIKLGTGDDLQIYHDGSNSYIDDTGIGDLVLRGYGSVFIQKYTGEDFAQFIADGAVNLYYDNSIKFETTDYGAKTNGSHEVSSGSNQVFLRASEGSIEITRSSGGAYIDFKDSTSEDYDARLQENSGSLETSGNFIVNGSISATSAAGDWIATQAEAEAGTDNTQIMTPLRVAQAIAAQGGSVIESIQRGTFNVGSYSNWQNIPTSNLSITSVDMSKTMVNNLGTGQPDGLCRLLLTSSTNLQGYRLATTNTLTVSYEVIEFK